jgi:hypothetical protein
LLEVRVDEVECDVNIEGAGNDTQHGTASLLQYESKRFGAG